MSQTLDRVHAATPATPTLERAVTSYPVRRSYKPGVYAPPEVPGVVGAIDIHCHAHEGQADALAIAKLASQSGMSGLLYKTIGPTSGPYRPAAQVDALREQLHRWSDESEVTPVECWAGYLIGQDMQPPSVERVRENLQAGVVAVWLPVFNHANSFHRVGARKIWIDKSADPTEHTPPMLWEDALRHGHYALDERGALQPVYEEIIRLVGRGRRSSSATPRTRRSTRSSICCSG
jgi:hypothetical protein